MKKIILFAAVIAGMSFGSCGLKTLPGSVDDSTHRDTIVLEESSVADAYHTADSIKTFLSSKLTAEGTNDAIGMMLFAQSYLNAFLAKGDTVAARYFIEYMSPFLKDNMNTLSYMHNDEVSCSDLAHKLMETKLDAPIVDPLDTLINESSSQK